MNNTDRPVVIGGVYKHFKGFTAHVLSISKHTETGEELVVYECTGTGNSGHTDGIYARPIDMFLSEVDHEKYPDVKQKYRFEYTGNRNNGTLPPSEYSKRFDELRRNRVEVGFYKYGSAKKNFDGYHTNALETMQMCIDKYKDTKNTEYLCDAANYLMFEFMYPSLDGAHFRATDSSESAGVSGFTVKDIEREVAGE